MGNISGGKGKEIFISFRRRMGFRSKEFYLNGKKLDEVDWKSDNREENRIEYDENGSKLYKGDYKNDKPEGKGKLYYENGNKLYEGDWKDGKV